MYKGELARTKSFFRFAGIRGYISGDYRVFSLHIPDHFTFQPQAIEKLMKKLVSLYETKEDDMSRSAIGLVLKSVAKAKIEHIKDNEELLAPTVFLAMHAPKDDGQLTQPSFTRITGSFFVRSTTRLIYVACDRS